VNNLTILNGNISATGGDYGAGIGSGYGYNSGTSSVNNLTVLNGNISATGGSNGAGIGSGYNSASVVSRIEIANGYFSLGSSTSGIGIGDSSSVESLMIGSGFFNCSALNNALCFNSDSLSLNNGSITVITSYTRVGPSSQDVNIVGKPELYFGYLSKSSKEEFRGISLVHLESIASAVGTTYNLSISETEGREWTRCNI
jgi:hypothetical protein